MGRSLGVADSKADIDDGTIQTITKLTTTAGATIGFYGATAVAQPSGATQATLTATWVTLSGGTGFGFSSSDQIISVITAIQVIQSTLKTLGLWKGSA